MASDMHRMMLVFKQCCGRQALMSPEVPQLNNHKLTANNKEMTDGNTQTTAASDTHSDVTPVYRHRVFIYGTLKKGQPNEHKLWDKSHGHARFIGYAHTKEKWPLILGTKYNIPLLVYAEGNGKILQGEIYEIDDRMLAFMDHFEGHPIVYERDYITVVKHPRDVITDGETNHVTDNKETNTDSSNTGRSRHEEGKGEGRNDLDLVGNGTTHSAAEETVKLLEEMTVKENGAPCRGGGGGVEETGKKDGSEAEEIVTCYAYFLKNFKQEYLQRPLLSNYDDNHNHLRYTPGPTLKCADDILQVMKEV